MEQSRDGTKPVGSNKRQIYSSESRGGRGKKASTSKQGSRQAGSETLPIAVGRGCIDQDEAGRQSLLRLYFRCCPCSCLLAPSRKPPLSRRPSFFGSSPRPFELLQLGANHHHRQAHRRPSLAITNTSQGNLPSQDRREPHRGPRIHSFSNLSLRHLARSWITGFLFSFSLYFFPILPAPLFLLSRRCIMSFPSFREGTGLSIGRLIATK